MIVEVMALLSLVSVFPLTVFSASAILRDREHAMEEMIFTTSVDKPRFLFERFVGVLLATYSLMLCATAGMIVAPLSGMIDTSRVGPTVPLHYLQAFAFVVVPDILFAAALVFAIAALTRSAPASYVGSVVIYLLYFVAAALTSSPLMAASKSNAGASMTLASLLDPIGLSALFEQIRYWTVVERNTTMVALSGNLFANRLIWTAASFVILAIVVRTYPFRLMSTTRTRTKHVEDGEMPVATPHRAVEPRPRPFQQFLAATRLEVRLLVANVPFVVLLLAWIAFVVPEVLGSIVSGEYGSPFLPMTSLVVGRLFTPLSVLGTIAMIYWSSESFWRDRSVRFEPIIAATPAAGPTLFTSRLAALAVMVFIITSVGAAVGIVIQLGRGGAAIDPLGDLGYFALGMTPLVIFAAGCGVIHVLSSNKYAGMLFCFALAAFMYRGHLAGVEHHLLRFGTNPPVAHSDMVGFSDLVPFAWFSLYWTLVAAALSLVAGILWRRHDDEPLVVRLRSLSATSKSQKLALLGLAVVALAVGAFIFTNTNVINRYETSDDILDWKADYEKVWESAPSTRSLGSRRSRRMSTSTRRPALCVFRDSTA